MSAVSSQLPEAQKPNGFLGKSEVISTMTAPSSHDNHMTSDNTGTSDGECAVYDQTMLMEDPFYNFDEMGQNSIAVQSILDPSNPNAIPFLDDCYSEGVISEVGTEFNPELFNSILSTGDSILARLESASSATSGSLSPFESPVAMGEGGAGGGAVVEREGEKMEMESEVAPSSTATGIYTCVLNLLVYMHGQACRWFLIWS